jgi:uncharacterized protein (DUF1499 family)
MKPALQRVLAPLLTGALWAGSAAAAQPTQAPLPAEMASRLVCPDAPNCVNSLGASGLAPLAYTGSAEQGLARLRATLAGFSEARIERADASSLTAIFTTRLGFRDEVVFVLDAARPVIHFRSRSLLGYYDFGKNRARMQAVAERFVATSQP